VKKPIQTKSITLVMMRLSIRIELSYGCYSRCCSVSCALAYLIKYALARNLGEKHLPALWAVIVASAVRATRATSRTLKSFSAQCHLSPALEAEGRLRAFEPRCADPSKLDGGRAAPPQVVRAVVQVVLHEEGAHHCGMDFELDEVPISVLQRSFHAVGRHAIERRHDGVVWRVPERDPSAGFKHGNGELAL
jgi:hypothetical protein